MKYNSIKLVGVFLVKNTVYVSIATFSVVSSVVIWPLSHMLL